MTVNKKRPVNLDLLTIKQPVTAISSILHRITGVVLFLSIPLILWGLSQTLSSAETYSALQDQLTTNSGKFIVWAILSSLSYHVVAGFRHLVMDLGIGETFDTAKTTSTITILVGISAAVFWGTWLW